MFTTDFRNSQKSVEHYLAPFVGLFILGTSCLGIYDIIRVPIQGAQGGQLYDTGNMRDPQFYMVSLFFLFSLWGDGFWEKYVYSKYFFLFINLAGIILHFKRGVWLAFLVSFVLLAGLKRKWSMVLVAVSFVCVLLLLPQTRERIHLLKEVTTVETGGRWVLWTQVAPQMLKDHPGGVGFCGIKHEDFLNYSPHIQPGLEHLHSNVLQIALEVGRIGLCIWLYWMSKVLWVAFKNYVKDYQQKGRVVWLITACFVAFSSLLLNGLVEYNFGDSEILMVISFLMGMIGVIHKNAEKPSETQSNLKNDYEK